MTDQEIVSDTAVVVVHSAEQREDKPVRVRMNKKAKLRAIAELRHGQNANLNIYDVPRKLLIFDVNKVLLFRHPKSPRYQVRPYAHEFIKGMSERYAIGVWTSMTKRFAVPILAELFPPGGPQLQFQWYQTKCRAIHGDNADDKPIFLKELHRVWGEHRMFNDSNTILVDDSSEKCTRNAPWTSIHPLPYEPFAPRPPPPPPPPPPPLPPHPPGNAPWTSIHPLPYEPFAPRPPPPPRPPQPPHPPASASACTTAEAVRASVDEAGGAQREALSESAVEGEVARSRSPSPSRSPHMSGVQQSAVRDGILPPEASPGRGSAHNAQVSEVGDAAVRDHGHTIIVTSGRSDHAASPTTRYSPPEASIDPRLQDSSADAAEIDISDVAVKSSDAYRINTSIVGDRDAELIPNGPLWVYLDRIAQYDGHVRDIYDLCGPYKHST